MRRMLIVVVATLSIVLALTFVIANRISISNIQERPCRTGLDADTKLEIDREFPVFCKRRNKMRTALTQTMSDFSLAYAGNNLRFRYSALLPCWIYRRIYPGGTRPLFPEGIPIDLAGKGVQTTDCRDYSELFKEVFNHLAKKTGNGARCKRVYGDYYLGRIFLITHDFNQIILPANEFIYVDPTLADTPLNILRLSKPAELIH